MFDIVDSAFSYERELIVCSFLQDFSKGKGSSLQLICNAHTVFLLCDAELENLHAFSWKVAYENEYVAVNFTKIISRDQFCLVAFSFSKAV